jgi:predicted transcriptional regulator
MAKKRLFGELELEILKIFQGDKILTVRDVLVSLGSVDKYTTVMTVMNRMVEKKQLQRERNGHQYEYKLYGGGQGLLERIMQRLFGGKSASMISYLIEDVSDEELEEVEKLIQHVRQERNHAN